VSTVSSIELRHPLFGAAALALVDDDAIAALHLWAAGVADGAAERAYHLAAAGDPEARDAAVEAANGTTSLLDRARLLEIAARLTPPGSHDAFLVDAADAMVDAGRYEPAQGLLGRMDPPDRSIATRRVVALARATWARNDLESVRQHVDKGIELLEGSRSASQVDLLSIRTRLSARVDWDVTAALATARDALTLAEDIGERLSTAHGAMGTALLRSGDPRFVEHLRSAIDLAGDDVVSGAIAADTLFMGQLLLGDPASCRPLAEDMVERTRGVTGLWEQQFRKNALLTALHSDCDYDAVLTEAPRLLRAPATPRIREHLEATLVLAHADRGNDEAALQVAATMSGLESADMTARAMAAWSIAEAHWLAGRPELGWEAAREAAGLPVVGFPAHVLASVVGGWCSQATDMSMDAWTVESPFPNLQPAREELGAIRMLPTDPAGARDAFLRAARGWSALSRRYAIRARWAAGESAAAADDAASARELLLAAEQECVELSALAMLRRIRRALRGLGIRRRDAIPSEAPLTSTQQLVLGLVARGLTSRDIARQLAVSATTVDTHVRSAMRELGTRTRLAAAIRAGSDTGRVEARRIVLTCDHEDHEVAQNEARARGQQLVDLAYAARAEPSSDRSAVAKGSVSDFEDASSALAAVYRGYGLVLRMDPKLRESLRVMLVDGLRRLGTVEIRKAGPSPSPLLSPLQRRLLAGLAAGSTITELAVENAMSRRTVERKLAAARSTLGARSNAEAVISWRRAAA
jgi:DNA-binding NarL/FixJ family response regulator